MCLVLGFCHVHLRAGRLILLKFIRLFSLSGFCWSSLLRTIGLGFFIVFMKMCAFVKILFALRHLFIARGAIKIVVLVAEKEYYKYII